jgi:hypothetical protein
LYPPGFGSSYTQHYELSVGNGAFHDDYLKTLELIDAGTKMILEGSLQDSPYSENMMEAAYASRNITSVRIKDHSDGLLPP